MLISFFISRRTRSAAEITVNSSPSSFLTLFFLKLNKFVLSFKSAYIELSIFKVDILFKTFII